MAVKQRPVDEEQPFGGPPHRCIGLAEIEATGQNSRLGIAFWQIGVPQEVVRDQCRPRAVDHDELTVGYLDMAVGPEQVSQATRGQVVEVGVVAQFVRRRSLLDRLPGP